MFYVLIALALSIQQANGLINIVPCRSRCVIPVSSSNKIRQSGAKIGLHSFGAVGQNYEPSEDNDEQEWISRLEVSVQFR